MSQADSQQNVSRESSETPAAKALARVRGGTESREEAPAAVDRVARSQESRTEAPRERPKIAGGLRLKLHVQGEVPGYKLIWANNDQGEIEQLLEEGFEFVRSNEIQGLTQGLVADSDVGDRVSRHAGLDSEGKAMRAYLMKYPMAWWEERERERTQQAENWDREVNKRFNLNETEAGIRKLPGQRNAMDVKFSAKSKE